MMRQLLRWRCAVLPALVCGLAVGCLPQGGSRQDERKEPHFLSGVSRVKSLDFQGAIESFEKALEANPRSASAHFELGLLNYQRVNDYAAAIYHFERFIKLRPDDPKVERANECVLACKQELARQVDFTPLLPSVQRNLETLMNSNRELKAETTELKAENERLRAQLVKWSQFYESLQQQQRDPGQAMREPVVYGGSHEELAHQPEPVVARVNPQPTGGGAPESAGAHAQPAATRVHRVQRGETFYSIAQAYRVDVKELQQVNPGIQPTRLQVGQSLRLPGGRSSE